MQPEYNPLSRSEMWLIDHLRTEANSVKECFTKLSFQAIALSSAALGIMIRYQVEFPYISFASIFISTLLLSVARIGTFKYGTANRHFGYELHLYRTKMFTDSMTDGWKIYMRGIGWEEAMRAWRVVQATAFSKLYYSHGIRPSKLRQEYRDKMGLWCEPDKLVEAGTEYYSGSYLKAMLSILHLLSLLSMIPLAISIFQLYCIDGYYWIVTMGVTIISLLFIFYRMIVDQTRRKILECGILSIHSCAIMWQAVVLSHYRALHMTRSNYEIGLFNYTKCLSQVAKDLIQEENILFIHKWINGTTDNKYKF